MLILRLLLLLEGALTTEMVRGELGKGLAGGTIPPSAVGARQQGGFGGAPRVSLWVFL